MLLVLVVLLSGSAVVSSTRQVITSCPIDMYAIVDVNGNDILGCFPCAACPPGYGVQHQCSTTQNTVCDLCRPGTFKNTTSKTETCSPCSRCSDNRKLEDCTPLSDTVCKKDCEQGFYYDRVTDACLKCSYCFPNHPYAQTVRVEDCRLQGMDDLNQCSPLPSPNNQGESHRPPSSESSGQSEGNLANTRLGRQPSPTDQRQGLRRHNNHNGRRIRTRGKIQNRKTGENTLIHERVSADFNEDITSTARSDTRHISSPAVTTESPLILRRNGPHGGFNTTNGHILSPNHRENSLSDTSGVDVNSPSPRTESPSHSSASDEIKIGEQQQNQGYKALTRSDIGVVVLIALACGLVSFVTTAVTCHFLMRRGKNVGATVSVARSDAPKKAWVYQDMMPSTVDLRPLIDTPPQTRKMTCV